MSAGNWCLIESDPGVFSELIRGFGVRGVQVEELYSLDEEQFVDLKPVYGLIFLFKWRPGDEISGTLVADDRNDRIFFAQQVIQNACATQAIINLLLNCPAAAGDFSLGTTLSEFASFTQGFDPADRGLALSNTEAIRQTHNSFARPTVFEFDEQHRTDKDDDFHFVTYVPVEGRVYELDGLLEAPVDLGRVEPGTDWLDTARPLIQKRIQKYSEGEIHFNLMAVVGDRMQRYERHLAQHPDDEHTKILLADERVRRAQQQAENVRRRHNYVPFIVELLRCLAEDGKLVPLVQQALENQKAKKQTTTGASGNVKNES